jgi:hypothetical protein
MLFECGLGYTSEKTTDNLLKGCLISFCSAAIMVWLVQSVFFAQGKAILDISITGF